MGWSSLRSISWLHPNAINVLMLNIWKWWFFLHLKQLLSSGNAASSALLSGRPRLQADHRAARWLIITACKESWDTGGHEGVMHPARTATLWHNWPSNATYEGCTFWIWHSSRVMAPYGTFLLALVIAAASNHPTKTGFFYFKCFILSSEWGEIAASLLQWQETDWMWPGTRIF